MEIKRKPKLKEMLSLAGQVRNWRELPERFGNPLSLIEKKSPQLCCDWVKAI